MKKKKLMSAILSLVLALSLSVTTIAADATLYTGNLVAETYGEVQEENAENSDIEVTEETVEESDNEVKEENETTVQETEEVVETEVQPQEEGAELAVQTVEEPEAVALNADEWTTSDFTYSEMTQKLNGCGYKRTITISGRVVAGFSESGLEKLKTNKDLVLPSTDDTGEILVGVADGAFKEKGLTSVKFPEGMMVDYDDTVTNVVTRRGNYIIGYEAFAKNELTSVNLPEGVIAVMSSSFVRNKLTSVTFPHTIWWIENSSFAYNQLTTVGFPKTCDFQLQIHAFAFSKNNIKSVRLPDYTEVVEKKAFYYNPGMEECPAEAGEKEQGMGGVVYMYTDNANLATKERIHHIERKAESQHSWHQRLIIGSKPAEEGEWAVEDFTYDGTVITGLSESGIAKRAENKNLVLPDKNAAGEHITEIAAAAAGGYGLFATEKEGFDSVVFPVKLEKIGACAFQANGLTKISEFPSTLKVIEATAFQTNKLTSVILPDSVILLGNGAFATNPLLEKIILSKGLTEIPDSAFGCSTKTEYMTNLTELVIPEGITRIGTRAFAGNNIKNIVIPSTVKEIADYAFSTKNYLDGECTVTLPEGLEKIGNRAFRNKAIKEVDLPTTVTGIKANTFEKEYSDGSAGVVTKVYVTKAQYADKDNFATSSYHEYSIRIDINDTTWDAFDFTYAEGAERKLSTLNGSTIQVTSYEVTGLSELGLAKIKVNPNLVIPSADTEGRPVTGTGKDAFKGNTSIESVTFPDGIMVDFDGPEGMLAEGFDQRGNFIVGYGSFQNCKNLKEATLPEGVLCIDTYAFRGCALTEIELPHTVGWINSGAFAQNDIESVAFEEIHDFNLYIGQQAFATNQIKAVQLPKGVEFVGKMAFVYNTGMEGISSEAPTNYKAADGYGVVYMYADETAAAKDRIYHVNNTKNQCYAQLLITDKEMPSDLRPWGAADFTFTENEDGTVTLAGLSDKGIAKLEKNTKVVIPTMNADGKVVTAIGVSAFDAGTDYSNYGVGRKITAVKIPSTIVSIGNFAFRNTQLKEVILPNSVEKLGTGAFLASQDSTIEKVVLSDKLTEIPSNCFQAGISKISEIVIPEGVIKIGGRAFAGSPITSLVLPSTLEDVGTYAFAQHQLTELVITDKVKSIGTNAFTQSAVESTLMNVTLGEKLESIAGNAFNHCALSEVAIPAGLKTLHKDAFKNGSNKVNVYTSNKAHLDGSVKGIVVNGSNHQVIYSNLIGNGWSYNDFTFDGATITGWSVQGHVTRLKNKNLVIPAINPETGEAITAIGEGAFAIPYEEVEQLKDGVYSPNGMKTIKIPDTVTTIGAKAFEYNSLTTVDFSKNLTTIGVSAFHGNTLKEVVLPDNITSLGEGVFSTNNITSLTLSKGLTVIPAGAFSMNIWLDQIEIPDTIIEIGQTAFAGASLTSLTIPSSVTKIGEKAFHLHHLTELVVPGNVKEIGVSAFEGTPKAITLEELTLEEGIEKIGANAFKEGYLESVKLPKSLISLDATAFASNAGTNNDHVVVCYTENSKHLEFPESTSHVIVYNTDWEAADFTYADNEDGTVTITGFAESGKTKVGYNTEVVIPFESPEGKKVTKIGASAFDAGTNMSALTEASKMTSVVFPDTIKEIGNFAFRNTHLKEVILTYNIEKLGTGAFLASVEGTIEKVILSPKLTEIPTSCFSGGNAGKIKEVEIPVGVKTIGNTAFSGNPITSLLLPNTLESIGRSAFAQHQLTELVIPDSVSKIENSAFSQNQEIVKSTLKRLVLGSGVKEIGSDAFRKTALTEVTIPEGLTKLDKNTFRDGTEGVVKVYTANYEHLTKLAASTHHVLAFNGAWTVDCFTYEGTVVTGLSEKGQALVENNKDMVLADKTPEGQNVTGIGAKAFEGLMLISVKLPTKLEEIGEQAFAGNKLTKVELPDTMEKIAEDAFAENGTTVELYTENKTVADKLKDVKFKDAKLNYSAKSEEPEKPSNTDKTGVATGDQAMVIPFAVSALVALAAIVAIMNKKKAAK